MKKKLPKFGRQNYAQIKRVRQTGWRKPRGIDNKLRISLRSAGFLPKIGFRTSVTERGLHPSGLHELRISKESDLKELDSKVRIAIRLSAGLGGKSRELLTQAAEKLGFKVLNPERKKREEKKTVAKTEVKNDAKAEVKTEAKTDVKSEHEAEEKKV